MLLEDMGHTADAFHTSAVSPAHWLSGACRQSLHPSPPAGVSLCEAEASVAAPMTSKQQSITSMISVVAEGRCALLATYQIFQFIVGYAMAQAFATNLMYTHALQMGNFQYLIAVSGRGSSSRL